MINWEHWLGSRKDATEGGALGLLHNLETTGLHMIRGVFHLLWFVVPGYLQDLLHWLQTASEYCVRVAMRTARVSIVFASLLMIVFLPLALYPSVIAAAWTCLALIGAAYGLCRQQRKAKVRTAPAPKIAKPYYRV